MGPSHLLCRTGLNPTRHISSSRQGSVSRETPQESIPRWGPRQDQSSQIPPRQAQRNCRPPSVLHPHPFSGEVRSNGREHLYRWDNPPVISPDAELTFGDCIHNLRSALDHLAYQLVVLNKRTPGNKTFFPIHDRPPRTGVKHLWRKRPLVRDVSVKAYRLIESVQPYKRGNIGGRLAELRDLDNIDKHRHLLVTVQAIDWVIGTAWRGAQSPPYGLPECRLIPNAPIHGQVAARVRWPVPHPNLDPNLHLAIGIRLDKSLGKQFARRPLSGVVSALITTVEEDVVNRLFAPLF